MPRWIKSTYRIPSATASSRAVGIHIAFAPTVDVNNNPANPVINVRSFGEDPRRVAAMAAAICPGAARGGSRAGVLLLVRETGAHEFLPLVTLQLFFTRFFVARLHFILLSVLAASAFP